jgi:hypothetical protein
MVDLEITTANTNPGHQEQLAHDLRELRGLRVGYSYTSWRRRWLGRLRAVRERRYVDIDLADLQAAARKMGWITSPAARFTSRASGWSSPQTSTSIIGTATGCWPRRWGDVVFIAARGVVLVHRERAEHIARLLGWRPEAMVREQACALPARTSAPVRRPTPLQVPEAEPRPRSSRWRAACGLGIVAGILLLWRRWWCSSTTRRSSSR